MADAGKGRAEIRSWTLSIAICSFANSMHRVKPVVAHRVVFPATASSVFDATKKESIGKSRRSWQSGLCLRRRTAPHVELLGAPVTERASIQVLIS